MAQLANLSNNELRIALHKLVETDRMTELELAWHLLELEKRRLFLEWGYCSLWDFMTRELRWSEATSVRRRVVARLFGRLPDVAPYVADGRISFCVMAVLAPQLKEDGLIAVLDKAIGMTRRQAESYAVELGAKPVAPRKDVIRLVGALASPPTAATSEPVTQPVVVAPEVSVSPPCADKPIAPALPERALRLHRVAFDAHDDFVANVARLREVLGNAALNELMLRASEALLDRVDPIRRHIRRENRKARKTKESLKQTITSARSELKILRHRQPLAVRDEVSTRDSAQCSYVSRDGTRCAERTWLHIDHIRPFAMGGSSTDVDNNRVLCAAHNLARSGAARASEL